jgi:lipopolysaccharide/colanic/teichoic acid biosynthesis glycosyltransferase
MIQAPLAAQTRLEKTTGTEAKSTTYTTSTQVKGKRFNKIVKALVDYALTIPALLLISPLLLAIALLIKLGSPGPIIYRRRVLGLKGHVFYAYKFRTMYVNADEILATYPRLRTELNRNYKPDCDPRLTRVGQLLHKFSLDELPQLFNVLTQDMSLVGPRLITPEEIVKYGPYGNILLTVAPGLTGLWQISGRYDIPYHERAKLDVEYIKNWSAWLDIKIILRTFLAVLRGVGPH